MDNILKIISGILVILLAASAIYSWLAGQYPVNSLALAIVLIIITVVRAVYGKAKMSR